MKGVMEMGEGGRKKKSGSAAAEAGRWSLGRLVIKLFHPRFHCWLNNAVTG